MNQALFPSLSRAFEDWQKNNNLVVLQKVFNNSASHWQQCAENILKAYEKTPDTIQEYIMQNESGFQL